MKKVWLTIKAILITVLILGMLWASLFVIAFIGIVIWYVIGALCIFIIVRLMLSNNSD